MSNHGILMVVYQKSSKRKSNFKGFGIKSLNVFSQENYSIFLPKSSKRKLKFQGLWNQKFECFLQKNYSIFQLKAQDQFDRNAFIFRKYKCQTNDNVRM